jgi:hypothetical protein
MGKRDSLRAVTHMDVTSEDIIEAIKIINKIFSK